MVKTYKKDVIVKLSDHFSSIDFDCKCKSVFCDKTLIDDDLITGLEALIPLSGPFKINSGFRCMRHNEEIEGATNSQHLLGKAADCKSLRGYNGNCMSRFAEQVPLFRKGGIGIYFTFVHVDVRNGTARWSLSHPC